MEKDKSINNILITNNFRLYEYDCPCCRIVRLSSTLVSVIQKLRDYIEIPVRLTSGFRCSSHNEKVGGKVNSGHKKGCCVDIESYYKIRQISDRYWKSFGFTKVLFYLDRNFIHLSVRGTGFLINRNYKK